MRKCKFFDNKKWLTKDKKSENTYQNVLAGFIYYWRIYFLSTQSTFKQTFTSMYFFCTFFMSKSLFSIKIKCLKKCLKSRIFTLLVVVATLHTPHAVSVGLKRFGWSFWGLTAFYQQAHTLDVCWELSSILIDERVWKWFLNDTVERNSSPSIDYCRFYSYWLF